MTSKEKIIFMYYEKKLNIIEIAEKLKVSKQYVSKVIREDPKYLKEKMNRKLMTTKKHREKNKECIKKKRQLNKNRNERLDASLKALHRQASAELSNIKATNNRAFKKWNSSIYNYNNKTNEFRVKENFKDKVSYAVPKKIKWD